MDISLASVSDTHFVFEHVKLPKADIITHSGDFSLDFGDIDTVKEFHAWLRSEAPDSLRILVPGNHDRPTAVELLRARLKDTNDQQTVILEDEYFQDDYSGLRFLGTPRGVYDAPNPRARSYHGEEDALRECFSSMTYPVDVLVSHSPPHNILDTEDHSERHFGSRAIAELVERTAPVLHLFGHAHASHGMESRGSVMHANVAICRGGRHIAHAPTVFHLRGDRNDGWELLNS